VKRLLVTLAALAALAWAGGAAAHPLGNFSVNRFGAIELAGDRIYVHYVLDLAEIPAFQEGDAAREPGFAELVGRALVLELDGRRVPLTPLDHVLRSTPGAGGLDTLRFEAVYAAPEEASGRKLAFRDTSFARRIGWREVVVRASGGARIVASTAPARSVSDELRAYPGDLLKSPLDVAAAHVEYVPGTSPGAVPTLQASAPPARGAGGFEALIARDDLGPGAILIALVVAAFWGAAHALTPGHGKAIVAGYLVGSRGRPRHAFLLGGIVTATHTAGVFALGLLTLLLSRFIVPERLYPWLAVASGLLVVVVGAGVVLKRVRSARGGSHHHHHHHHHHHDHEHEHGFGRGGLVGVGVAAGLLPCPSALVVLLSAIALHRVGLGLALIVAFSVGLAATITAIGLLAVLARRTFGRLSLNGRLVRALPAVSALVILAVGIGIIVDALPEVL
jgi:nickel/cobalt exporter